MNEPSFIEKLELILERIEGAASNEQIDAYCEEAYHIVQAERALIRARKASYRAVMAEAKASPPTSKAC